MIKINYPNITTLINKYIALPIFTERKKLFDKYKRIHKENFNIIFRGIGFETLLKSSFEENIQLIAKIESNIRSARLNIKDEINDENRKIKKEVFKYDGEMQQHFLSKFFEEHINPKTCFYCNIDFINVFASRYADVLDFLNNASKNELEEVDDVGDATSDNIIGQRPIVNINNLTIRNKANIIYNINNLDIEKLNTKNGFTLDHFLEKSEYPYLALNLFNLVPSCSICNSKLKGTKDIGNMSPTQDSFDFHTTVKFKIFINTNLGNPNFISNLTSVSNKDKIKLRLIENTSPAKYEKYIEVFRLNARYNFHKYLVEEMIDKRKKYPECKIKALAKWTGQTPEQVKKDLFGEHIFASNLSERPFSKLTKDIAEQLGLI